MLHKGHFFLNLGLGLESYMTKGSMTCKEKKTKNNVICLKNLLGFEKLSSLLTLTFIAFTWSRKYNLYIIKNTTEATIPIPKMTTSKLWSLKIKK